MLIIALTLKLHTPCSLVSLKALPTVNESCKGEYITTANTSLIFLLVISTLSAKAPHEFHPYNSKVESDVKDKVLVS